MTEASSERPPASANFINPKTVHPPFGYSHVVEVTAGRLVFIAGQVALDPAGTLVGADDIRARTRQVFDNLRAALERSEPASSRSSSSTSTWSTPPRYR